MNSVSESKTPLPGDRLDADSRISKLPYRPPQLHDLGALVERTRTGLGNTVDGPEPFQFSFIGG